MSNRSKSKKPGQRVLANGRNAPLVEPYASISSRMLGSKSFRQLSGAAMRLLMLLEANFNPNRETILPTAMAVSVLRVSFSTVQRAFSDLRQAGFVVLVREGWRPGRMGSKAGGLAAVYKLPHRMTGSANHISGTASQMKEASDPKLARIIHQV